MGGKGSLGEPKNGDLLGKTGDFMWDNINNIYGFHMELLLRNWFGEVTVTLVIYMGFIWNSYFGTGLVK